MHPAEPNQLKSLKQLYNRYWVMRHGQSVANQRGQIISAAKNGVMNCGLSEVGRLQVEQSVNASRLVNEDTLIYASDFKRAEETALIVSRMLSSHVPVSYAPALRERFFGDYERGTDQVYPQVWSADAADPSHTIGNVESVNAVTLRVTAYMAELEKQHCEENILLIAHGDVLQLLQAAFLGVSPSEHRKVPHLKTAEIRELKC